MKIDFQVETKYGVYGDAILVPDDAPMTDEEVEAEKQRRVDNWIAIIETPAIEEAVAPEEPPLEPEA
jgi:hypothetical protein